MNDEITLPPVAPMPTFAAMSETFKRLRAEKTNSEVLDASRYGMMDTHQFYRGLGFHAIDETAAKREERNTPANLLRDHLENLLGEIERYKENRRGYQNRIDDAGRMIEAALREVDRLNDAIRILEGAK